MGRSLAPPNLPPPRNSWESSLISRLREWFVPASAKLSPTVGPAIASAATITPAYAKQHVTGTVAIVTILVPPDFSGELTLIPDGLWTTTAAGNIAKASTAIVGQPMVMHYDPATQKFYPSY